MENIGYLPKTIALLSAAVLVVAVFRRINLSPVLGYLVAGAFIGEYGLGFANSEDLSVLAEFGVVFLLFAIGLELTIDRLMSMRWHVFGFGTAQVLITSFIIAMICKFSGISIESSIVIGGALALSSTAIVLRVLSDNNAHNTQVGRLSLANLLLQDFAVVPLLVLVPLLASKSSNIFFTIGSAMVHAFLVMLLIFFIGRLILRPVFSIIASAKSSELFLATTLLLVIGAATLTKIWGGSLAMGAFIAGLLVAETQYQSLVEENIMPFKDLLMGLFFMTVGMTIHLDLIYEKLWLIASLSLALITIKAIIITCLSRLFRFPWGSSIQAGLLLAQGSEFAFILFGTASRDSVGIINQETTQILLIVVTLTMALTPLLSILGEALCDYINSKKPVEEEVKDAKEIRDLNRHVIIAGFNSVGEMVAKLLSAKKVNYVLIEGDSKLVKEARDKGYPILRGDPTKIDALRSVGIARAKTIILTIDDMFLKKSIRTISRSYPDLPIVVRANDLSSAKSLYKIGATIVVPEKYEAGLQLAGALLKAIGFSEYEVSQIKNIFRSNNYELAMESMDIKSESNKVVIS